MKRTTFIWACLALAVNLSLQAHNPSPVKTIEKIPNATLTVTVDVSNDILTIDTQGLDLEMKDWIIFNSDTKYVSRIETQKIINVISTKPLEAGTYQLMIKDKMGRALFCPFVIN